MDHNVIFLRTSLSFLRIDNFILIGLRSELSSSTYYLVFLPKPSTVQKGAQCKSNEVS